MTITNGYTTLAAIQARLNPLGISTNATDDTVIEDMVEAASRLIDSLTRRTFYARTETHYYNTPDDPYELAIDDDDLLTASTITNGDGDTISASEYKLYPLNTTPKYCIRLLPSAGVTWDTSSAGDAEAAITIAGTWGYSSTTPEDVRNACEEIVVRVYKARYGQAQAEGNVTLTASGIVITPEDLTDFAKRTIDAYKRYT